MLSRSMFALCAVACGLAIGCSHQTKPGSSSEAGFKSMFNGHDLTGWVYGQEPPVSKHGNGYQIRPEDQVLYSTAHDGGYLFTEKEYGNFDMRFEFKLVPAANNGIGIRAPLVGGNPSYEGMEIQILDDSAPKYAHLRPTQYCGSVYDVVGAQRGHLKPVGEWNSEEIYANGSHIVVILNGVKIVDTDLMNVTDEHVLQKHPGLRRPSGHIALLGHGSAVEFRHMRIKEL